MNKLQILFASDLEGGLEALDTAPRFAAIEAALEDAALQAGTASVTISAGDNFIPGPFFIAGGDLGLEPTLEGFYNEFFGLIDVTLLSAADDSNGDGFFDNVEIQAVIDATPLEFSDIYTTDVNGDGFADYFEEIDSFQGRIDVAIMNAIGFDAAALGNHEFDAGTNALANIINFDAAQSNSLSSGRFGTPNLLQEVDTPGLQFPFLTANLDFSGDPDLSGLFTDQILASTAFNSDLTSARADLADPALTGPNLAAPKIAPATVIDSAGQKIGVIGATTQIIAQISSTGTVDDISNPGADDMAALAAVLQPVIDDIINGDDDVLGTADDVTQIILTSQLQQFANEVQLAGLLRGVDVVLAGGSGTLSADDQDRLAPGASADQPFPLVVQDADGNDTAVLSVPGEFSVLGRLEVEFDADGRLIAASVDPAVSGAITVDDQSVIEATGAVDAAAGIAASTAAAQVQKLTEAIRGVIITQDSAIAGESAVFLNGERSQVRTQETNLGNLTADANLFSARQIDPEVVISIKNGGGIRDSIGVVIDNGDGTVTLAPPQANPLSGKEAGEISDLDIVNSLRFDNRLVTVDLTPAELKIVLEHAVAATAPGATPGQFAQVGGLQFSFDPAGTAQVLGAGGAVLTAGTRVQNVALIDETGAPTQQIITGGAVAADAPASLRTVTLNFLADGGDGFPLGAFSPVVDLNIGEQQALTDFLAASFPKDGPGFAAEDTALAQDSRIQNLSARLDSVGLGAPDAPFTVTEVATFKGEGGEAASEVVAQSEGELFVTNGALNRIDVFDIAAGTGAPTRTIDLTTLDGFGGVQSVAVANGILAAAIDRPDVAVSIFGAEQQVAQNGFVAIFDAATGALLSRVDVGNLPDQLAFNKAGTILSVAGEGELNEDSSNTTDPTGTVTLIDMADPTDPKARVIDFSAFNGLEDAARAAGIRIKPGASLSADLEPEYTAFSPDGATLYVSLQENNAIARLDVATGQITGVFSLGTVDFSSDSALDANDRDGVIDIRHYDNLVGLRMADTIATFGADGQTYILTANEGDTRGFDEDRVGNLVDDGLIDASVDTTGLERLVVSTTDGDTDGDGDIDVLHTFSSRSFSIFDANGTLVFDSGPEFEQIIANIAPERFNSDTGTDNENRSDNKGPEPEALAVGQIGDRTYAFIGLERDSGIMIYDVTDPAQSRFVDYIEPRFTGSTPADQIALHSPEVITFIPADESLTGNAQIAVAYEVSGTTAVFDLALPGSGVTLIGGDGDDDLLGGAGDDSLDGGEGNNRLRGEDGNDDLRSGDGADTINGGDGDDVIRSGRSDADKRDVIFAGVGNDDVDAGQGNDDLNGMEGNDTLLGGFGADRVVGGEGNDNLAGGAGSDEMFGNAGDDFLNGGFGFDRHNGGAGADTFFHLGVAGHGTDWVQDFSSADGDVLLFGSAASAGQFSVSFAGTAGAGAADVDEAFVINTQTGQIVWALVDGAAQDSLMLQIAGAQQAFDLLA